MVAGCKIAASEGVKSVEEVPLPLSVGPLSLSVTDTAVAHILEEMPKAKGAAKGIRVSVQKAGCSGYEYTLEYAYEILPLDYCLKKDGACIVVDRTILAKFMNGTTVDYRKEGVNEGLVFHNPRAVATCGCGESFTLGKQAEVKR